MDIINKSKKIFNELNVEELQKQGIEREDIKVSSHSHHIVTYPPLDYLPEIAPSKVYSIKDRKQPREIALYLHIPFCSGKCLYCSYITMSNQTTEIIDKYLDAVESEIDMLLKYPILQDIVINSIYIGGGTPTYLTSSQLDRVFDILKSKFKIKKDAEITIEAEPENIIEKEGEEKLNVLLKNGVNRLSIGFQTFNDNILKLICRRHDSKEAILSYNIAKKAGFKNINIDLIPGLPDQSLEGWKSDLEQISKLKPTSVTCYPLSIKQSAAIWQKYQKEKDRFPNKKSVIMMHIMANEFFNKMSYIQRPVWWFIKKPEYVYRQQIIKWGELGEQLALGVSGYSFINDFQYFNHRNIPEYLESIKDGKPPIWRGIKLSKEDLMRRLILFGLKTGFSKKLFKLKFGRNPKEVFKETWKKLEKLGLIEEDEESIKLTYKGILFADEISREFFSEKYKIRN